MPRVAVVMPVLNCLDYTRDAIRTLTAREPYRLIIIDNGSEEDTRSYLFNLQQNAAPGTVTIVRHGSNMGVAVSWNEGIRLALADPDIKFVLVTNNDVLFHPSTLDNLISTLETHPNWSMVTGWNVRESLAEPEVIHTLAIGEEVVSSSPDFSCFMLRRNTIEELARLEESTLEPVPGLFDEEFSRDGGAYFEDNDYHFRLRHHGLHAMQTSLAPYYHFGSRTQNQGPVPLVNAARFEANREYYVRKHGGLPDQERNGHLTRPRASRESREPIKILWYSDTPACASGFGQVAKNLLQLLHRTGKYDITVLGINQYDYYDRQEFPYRIHEAMPAGDLSSMQDPFGRQRLVDTLSNGEIDLLFTLQDSFIMESVARRILEARQKIMAESSRPGAGARRPFRWIYYFPVDSRPKESWVRDAVLLSDYPVCYTEWGKSECREVAAKGSRASDLRPGELDRIQVIYHGINPKDFYNIEDRASVQSFRSQYFGGLADDKFLIVNVNRNQPRKDLGKTLAAFSRFYSRHPDSFLYLHCQGQDVGGNLLDMANNFPNLRFMSNWGLPDVHRFGALHGVPTSVVNQIYNAADVVVSTTLGEGWGLSYTEAMAAGSPVIAPRNTSGLEVIGEKDERGLLYACGDHPSAFVMMANDNDRIRPLPNIEDLVEKLETVYRDREMALSRCAAAHDWVEKLHWDGDTIGRRWLDLLQGAWLDLNAASPRGEGLPEGRA